MQGTKFQKLIPRQLTFQDEENGEPGDEGKKSKKDKKKKKEKDKEKVFRRLVVPEVHWLGFKWGVLVT